MPRTTKQPTTGDAFTKRAATKRSTTKPAAERAVAADAAAKVSTTSANAIAQRAFELYCARGCAPGHDVEDWLRAEQELSA